jgi:hypothetical protein
MKDLVHIITKWRLNRTLLADRLGIHRVTFSNWLAGKQYYAFTDDQLIELENILKELKRDIERVIEKRKGL